MWMEWGERSAASPDHPSAPSASHAFPQRVHRVMRPSPGRG